MKFQFKMGDYIQLCHHQIQCCYEFANEYKAISNSYDVQEIIKTPEESHLGDLYYYISNYNYRYLIDYVEKYEALPKTIEFHIKSITAYAKQFPKIDLEDLCKEAFKPSRVAYQLSLDPEYYD